MKDPDIRSSIQIKVEQPSCVQPAVHVGKSWDDLNDISLGCEGTVMLFPSKYTPYHSNQSYSGRKNGFNIFNKINCTPILNHKALNTTQNIFALNRDLL